MKNKNEEFQERVAIKMHHGNVSAKEAAEQATLEVYGLLDHDQMPFGKYEGRTMENVPVYYFHWLYVNDKVTPASPVGDYIERNLSSLKAENHDLIWEKE